MSDVENSLRRLIYCMDEVGKPVAESINPGLSEDEITQRCRQAGIALSPEAVDLYRYCNGMKPSLLSVPETGEYGLDGFYLLRPLDVALRDYEWVKENAPYDDELSAAWFPFLQNDSSDMYLVDTAAAETAEPSVIWLMAEFSPIRKYSSLSAMFDTLADVYEAGAYEDRYGLQMSLIARRRNPNVPYWQERIQELSGSQS